MTKIYLVNIVIAFLSLRNQLKEPLMQNFVFLWLRKILQYAEVFAQEFVTYFNYDRSNIFDIEVNHYYSW